MICETRRNGHKVRVTREQKQWHCLISGSDTEICTSSLEQMNRYATPRRCSRDIYCSEGRLEHNNLLAECNKARALLHNRTAYRSPSGCSCPENCLAICFGSSACLM